MTSHNAATSVRASNKIIAGILVTVGLISPAYAYVDPGTGAMLLQMAMAAIGAALFYFRSALTRIGKLLSGSKLQSRKVPSSPMPDQDP